VTGERLGHRARHRAERCLVQHHVDVCSRGAARLRIANVTFDQGEAAELLGVNPARHVVEVAPVTSREIIEADHRLLESKQGLE
jgi:hypothetical protein